MNAITLKAARVNKGLKQSDVATALNVSKCTIVNWESGKYYPDIIQFKALCRLYDVGLDDIFLSES